ncbi:LAGLIDADG DNA endonuclease family protein [Methylovorus glucosotrophus]|uniref:LAGLIDADG family homing endonuclease n=1 Tax=Methylovorus glucosotrophus TaxID=266009 RepID=UPI0013318AE3|nr:LAGLIDADG family homing endonuclease [Methylovorus glucosotrophus]KAF0844336.1 LAGLIDADG DNA endonuclease family protein [Methylovorus glucosotrophus]
MDLELHEKQSLAFHSEATEILYGGAAGGGKALAIDTPIPTPSGWTTMGAIQVGDAVFDESGKPCTVVAATEIMSGRPCYQVTFCDGEQIIADASHQWLTFSNAERTALSRRTESFREARRQSRAKRGTGKRNDMAELNACREFEYLPPPTGSIVTTQQMAASLMVGKRTNHSIVVCPGLALDEISLPIDPYVLGVWLGDGTRGQGAIATADAQIVDEISARGYEVRKRPANKYAYGILGLQGKLRALGIIQSKEIPSVYLRASEHQRMELLRGLMDTDGTCNLRGACEFDNCDRALIESVHELLASLGIKSTIRTGVARLNGKDCGPKYRVKFTTTKQVFHLRRKAERLVTQERGTQRWRMVKSVEAIESVPVRCIQVDSPSHLFLAGRGMVPTHNSHLMRVLAIAWAMLVPGIQIYLFRRTYQDLWKNHMEGPSSFPALLADMIVSKWVKLNLSDNQIIFWNGSKIHLCHCQHEKDRLKYQGAEIHVLLIDELTHFTDTIYRFLRGRCRLGALQDLIPEEHRARLPMVMAGANPGGIGHHWVKMAFIDNVTPLTIRRMPNTEGGMLRQYIPAKLQDNPSMEEDYADKLAGLGSEAMVRAMLEGDWDIVAGAFFTEFKRERHVIKPMAIPSHWTKYRSFDWGSAKPFACYWIAVSDGTLPAFPRGALIVYREYYGMKEGEPNVGLKMTADKVAKEIYRKDRKETTAQGGWGVADPAIFSENGGISIAETMRKEKVQWRPGDNKRKPGWEQVRIRLDGDDDGNPMLFIFETCVHLIRTLPALQHDEHDAEDVDSDLEDHGPDALRYGCMARPYIKDTESKRKKVEVGTVAWVYAASKETKQRSRYRS